MKAKLAAVTMMIAPIIAMSNEPVSTLQIDQMQHVTNNQGKIIPKTILIAQVGKPVSLFLPDGKHFQGVVIRREEALKEYVKIYGELFVDKEQCGFGLILTAEGKLEGALVMRESQRTYVVDYDDVSKGFVFKFQQADKPFAFN